MAAFSVADGLVYGQCHPRKRFIDFRAFLETVVVAEAHRRGVQTIALVLDNGPTHASKQLPRWVEELANTRAMGSSAPNVLGIEGVDDDYLFVLDCLLKGLSLEQAQRAFAEDLSTADAENQRAKAERLYQTISDSIPFKSIFPASCQSPTRSTLPTAS